MSSNSSQGGNTPPKAGDSFDINLTNGGGYKDLMQISQLVATRPYSSSVQKQKLSQNQVSAQPKHRNVLANIVVDISGSEAESDPELSLHAIDNHYHQSIYQQESKSTIFQPDLPTQSTKQTFTPTATSQSAAVQSSLGGSRQASKNTNFSTPVHDDQRPQTVTSVTKSQQNQTQFATVTTPVSAMQASIASSPGDTVVFDENMVSLETALDSWTTSLKREVMSEFCKAKLQMIAQKQAQFEGEQNKFAARLHVKEVENENLKELLSKYEQHIANKDAIIKSLSEAMSKEKSRNELQKNFFLWRQAIWDKKHEQTNLAIADAHHHKVLKSKALHGWFGTIQSNWRQRVEKACQDKAKEVCTQLSADYEQRISEITLKLSAAYREIEILNAKRVEYEENMKKAFMRGVCALNMEAMGMFHEDTSQSIAGGVHAGHSNHTVTGRSSHTVPVAATHTNPQAATMSARGVNSESDNVSSQRKSTVTFRSPAASSVDGGQLYTTHHTEVATSSIGVPASMSTAPTARSHVVKRTVQNDGASILIERHSRPRNVATHSTRIIP